MLILALEIKIDSVAKPASDESIGNRRWRKVWLPNNFCKSTPLYSWVFYAVENLTMSQSEDASEP